ncbi:acetyltransferase (GNAT) family protein [Fontibacillus phaseoli]|uniref:Acetyltransferase (GNAT) family protein n=1 Tax=Fontibacillus phaseoli TaxID=1416533 RepID=A0A369BS74_9BACL|nr:GNAT family N-acetyltransferase [Fontibacillus phaseoli]RCX23277.1 acetyltransferase (GNAT) family protein [Fontibacillus phaseoli]
MEIRRVRENELNQAVALANTVFCGDNQKDMGFFFPTLFQAGISHSYGAFDGEGRLVSFMGLVPLVISSGSARLIAFSVGAVCTEPQFRGLGLAGELLKQCREHARRAGASLLFISGDRSLYTRAGSLAFGQAAKYQIGPQALAGSGTKLHSRDMIAEDIFALHALLSQKTAFIEWSVQELQQFVGSGPFAGVSGQEQHIKIAESSEGGIAAAAVFMVPASSEEGSHRSGQMLEWAGEPEAVMSLIADVISGYHLDDLMAVLPWQDTAVSGILQAAGIQPETQNNAGTVLIADTAALIRQARLNGEETDKPTISCLAEERFELRTAEGTFPINGSAELCSLLFDPYSPVCRNAMKERIALPLPYMYGLYFI